jgi:uncharacterized protein
MNEALAALLVVQDHDIAIEQLIHRRDHLPAAAELASVLGEAKVLMPQHQALTARRAVVTKEVKRIDDEVQKLRSKAEAVNTKLYSGTVTASKELQALQSDLDSIRAHVATLEDAELEQMQLSEEVDAQLEPVQQRLDALQAAVQRCQQAIVEGQREVDELLAAERAARVAAATVVSPALLSDYETRRANNKGFGAARLLGDTCQACRLSIPATEVDAIRHDHTDRAWYCDNCGSILVAT